MRSSSIIGGASFINIAIGIARIKVVAILLGPAGVGLVGLMQNLMGTASKISSFGIDAVGARQIAEANGEQSQAGVDSVRWALFFGVLILAVVGGICFWALRHIFAEWVFGDQKLSDIVGWLAVGVTISIAACAQSALMTGMRRIGDIARSQIASSLLFTIAGIAALYGFGEKGLLLYILSVPVIGFFVSNYFIRKLPAVDNGPPPMRVLIAQWKIMLRMGTALMLAGVAGMIGQLAVRMIVQDGLGSEAVGYFHAAFAISMTYLGFVLGAMIADYYPRLTAAMKENETAIRLVNEQTEVTLLLATPVLLSMLALAPWLIQLLYSHEFSTSTSILRWQILGDVLKIAIWPTGMVILAAGDGRTFMLTEFLAMAVFSLTTWIALPVVGIQATGLGFLLMYVINFPVIYILAKRRIGMRWSPSVKRDFILLLIASIIVFAAASWNDWVGLGVGLVMASVAGILAIIRLAHMVGLGGKAGKMANKAKLFLWKIGLYQA